MKTAIQSQNTLYCAFSTTAFMETGKCVDTDSPEYARKHMQRRKVLNMSVQHMCMNKHKYRMHHNNIKVF